MHGENVFVFPRLVTKCPFEHIKSLQCYEVKGEGDGKQCLFGFQS